MNQVRLSAVLDDLLQSLRGSRGCFENWARMIRDDELAQLFKARADVLAENEEEIDALLQDVEDRYLAAPELQIYAGSVGRVANDVIKSVGECAVFSACEEEYCSALMRYRDTLDYELPSPVYEVVARQFAALIDRHSLPPVGFASAPGGEAEALALP